MEITSEIKYQASISELILKYPCLEFLRNQPLKRSSRLRWERESENQVAYCLQVMFIGKTGYGKSTTVNHIVGRKIFDSSDIESCTKKCQSAMFQIHEQKHRYYFRLEDLPGVGESISLDLEYTNLYSKLLKKSDAVVYILRADQRDFSVDEKIFKKLFSSFREKEKVIIGLNSIDKIEPVNRTSPFQPSALQIENANKKVEIISNIFGVLPNKIVYYSAIEKYNLDSLVKLISQNLIKRKSKWIYKGSGKNRGV